MNALRDQIIDAITEEIRRIFGVGGFLGDREEYDWLLKYYGVTEDEDILWQYILSSDDVTEELSDGDPGVTEFLNFPLDDHATSIFLTELLKKYRSNALTYPSTVLTTHGPTDTRNNKRSAA